MTACVACLNCDTGQLTGHPGTVSLCPSIMTVVAFSVLWFLKYSCDSKNKE
jgi:hypothetical protein